MGGQLSVSVAHATEVCMTCAGLLVRRCAKTYNNYLGYVRTGTLLVGKSDEVFTSGRTALRRAKVRADSALAWNMRSASFIQIGIEKSMRWTPRPTMYIRKAMMQNVMLVRSHVCLGSTYRNVVLLSCYCANHSGG